MNRRNAMLAVIGLSVLAPHIARAQRAGMYRIGFLGTGAAGVMTTQIEALKAGLHELGYVQGKNLTIDYRWGEDNPQRLAQQAAALVGSKVELIVVWGTAAAFAAKHATSTIPIVLVNVGDPDVTGLVASLARPGGNITGVANLGGVVVAKQLELLRQVIPGITRIAILRNPNNPSLVPQLEGAKKSAGPLGLQLHVFDVRASTDLEPAFTSIVAMRASGVLVLAEPLFLSERRRIADLAIKYRLPAVSARSEIADAGLLMTYGASATEQFRNGASYVDKILRGTKAGDLPVEQAAKFEFVINLKTARTLGIPISDLIVVRADRVIQ